MQTKGNKINGRNSDNDDKDNEKTTLYAGSKKQFKGGVPAVGNGATNQQTVETKLKKIWWSSEVETI
jgi:hypothetical protein